MWRRHPLGDRYDVVIIGAGVHGLAIAYYLGKQGVSNVAVLDKGYLGGGASARSTASAMPASVGPAASPRVTPRRICAPIRNS